MNLRTSGELSGCRFIYTSGRTRQSSCRVLDVALQVVGLLRSTKRVVSLRLRGSLRAVLVYPNTLRVAIPFGLLSRLLRFPILLDVCEMPLTVAGTLDNSYFARKRLWLLYSLFHGVFCISDVLCRHVQTAARRGLIVQKMPVLVDANAFTRLNDPKDTVRQIVYAGTLSEKKDGVLTLIDAFAALPMSQADVRMVIAGWGPRPSDEMSCQVRVREKGLADRVELLGRLGRSETQNLVQRATVLALARPASLQAEAGFPTKLAEYLASSRPVVVTATGEIPNYLEDGVSAYLVDPGDTQGFANALFRVLSEPGEAETVGARGRVVAVQSFDFRANAEKLAALLRNVERAGRRGIADESGCGE